MQRVFSVLIVDKHELVRAGIRRILQDVPTVTVIGEAASDEEALSSVRTLRPDIVIMDIKMPGISGIATTQKMLNLDPDIKILVVSTSDDDFFPVSLLRAGAAGYITKVSTQSEMIQALKSICAGQRFVSVKIANHLALRNTSDSHKSPFDALSGRELQVMLMVISGSNAQDISEKLLLNPKTINSYRYRIFEKLGVKSDIELTLCAIKHGILEE